MDLKALIAKMDQIESKRFLTEDEDRIPAKKKETSWTDKSGKKHPATQVQGHQSRKADKEADKESKRKDEGIVFRSGIAQELLREFNLAEEEFKFSPEQEKWLGGADRQDPFILARMPGPKPPASYFTDPESQAIVKQRFAKVFTGAPTTRSTAGAAAGGAAGGAAAAAPAGAPVTSGSGAPVQSGTGGAVTSGTPAPAKPAAGGQAASPAPAGTPAGGVDDEGNIMPGFTTDENGNVVKAGDANFVEPATQKLAQQGRQAAKEKEYAANADAEDQAMGQAMAANAAGGPSSVNAQGQNVTMPDGTNPETGEKTQTATAAAPYEPLQEPPGAEKPAGGQAASPAAGGGAAWVKKLSPSTFAQATQLGLLQNGKPVDAAIKKFQKDNGLKDDGIIGPQTTIAIVSAANLDTSGKGGRGGQGGPTAAQMAQANAAKPATAAAPAKPAAGGQAASPAAGAAPDPVKDPAGYKKYMNDRIMRAQQQKAGQAASPAKPLPGKAVPGGGQISDTPAAESIDYSDINRLITLALWR